jgi:hypothetical protein
MVFIARDGYGSDSHGIGFGCHLSPYFNPDSNADMDLFDTNTKRMTRI